MKSPSAAADYEKTIPLSVATQILNQDGLCVYCGGLAEVIDHVFPWSLGGTTYLPNLKPACQRCNQAKGARTPEQWCEDVLDEGGVWPPRTDAHELLALLVEAADDPSSPMTLEATIRELLRLHESAAEKRLQDMPHGCGPHEVRTR